MTKNRKTGEMMREQQPLMKKIQLLLLFNPVTEWVSGPSLQTTPSGVPRSPPMGHERPLLNADLGFPPSFVAD